MSDQGWEPVAEPTGWEPVKTTPSEPASPSDILSAYRSQSSSSIDEQPNPLVGMLRSAAMPQKASDFLPLLIPGGTGAAIDAVKGYASAAKTAAQEAPSLRALPRYMLRTLYRNATAPPPMVGFDRYMPNISGVEGGAIRTVDKVPYGAAPTIADAEAAAGPTASAGLSAGERAQLARQGYSADLINRIEQQAGPRSPTAPMPESPFQQPRVQAGAERVGRQAGLTKKQVRQQTAPILDEAQGEASPIFPKNVLADIIDKMKTLPMNEREAYVAQATSGKAKWQVENIRRTLEHLGLLIPIGAAAAASRQAIIGRLGPSTDEQ